MKRSLVILAVSLLSLFLITLLFFVLRQNILTTSTRAAPGDYSAENSYVFVSPLRAKADNLEKVRVTVFLLNSQGLGAQAKKITFGNSNDLTITAVQDVTDESGKALFDVASSKAGTYFLEVLVEGTKTQLTAHLTFD